MKEWAYEDLIENLSQESDSKIVLVVLDGLGGLPVLELGGKTELEAANTPHLDDLARRSSLGLVEPVLPGIAPGSSAGHFGLFGYDPLKYFVGRGVLEALGIGFELAEGDIAVRANFATADFSSGRPVITDRRAGRPPQSETERLCDKLSRSIQQIGDVSIIIRPVKEHRFLVVLRGDGLGDGVRDTDPEGVGRPPLDPQPDPDTPQNRKTASVAKELIALASQVLADEEKANYVLLRGFSLRPSWTPFHKRYRLKGCAIATYPMYRGLARLVGMTVLDLEGSTLVDQICCLKEWWGQFDFYFLHIKATDARGEDGNFTAKMKAIEEFDGVVPELLSLNPTVLAITGDHSTPATYRAHSWHPVPLLLFSPWVMPVPSVEGFGERDCLKGSIGIIPSRHLMSLLLAHSGRLKRYQA
ncbi:MAG: 2,3-bisphosphoglycerate-independent phosphoglycerate mutase [Armatimonadetes bacterium]|nr:2,3-bisphosphoglycerate-independent phosphoglycerate mutase [Armatimonadota bacterium]MDW8122311.1 2,3-bisphosphoglycerate-independent phosphoglycerate mutase [Armatimonadota bacterium]